METEQTGRKKSDYLTLNIDQLLNFYDKADEDGSDVGAITGLIGEDLVLGALVHYFKGRGEVVSDKPIDYKCRGNHSWLDAWLEVSGKCYQIEVKNWSASSIGGRPVTNRETGKEELVETAHHNFPMYLDRPRNAKAVWKVLKDMNNAPENCGIPTPLLAFWSPIAPLDGAHLEPLFQESTASHEDAIKSANIDPKKHSQVHIFSASIYLRQLRGEGEKDVTFYMPRAARRLSRLHKLQT